MIVELNDGLEQIEQMAFGECTLLTSIVIPSTVKVIGGLAFAECSQLRNVELCEGLEQINNWAFQECSSLERIRIPSTVTWIGEGAFAGCSQLRNVELHEGLKRIDANTFCEVIRLNGSASPPPSKRFTNWHSIVAIS